MPALLGGHQPETDDVLHRVGGIHHEVGDDLAFLLRQYAVDAAKVKELWSPIHKAWFPKGVDDPNLGLLRVDVSKAEYWDSPSGKLVQLLGFAKALATGKPYAGEGSENEKVNL